MRAYRSPSLSFTHVRTASTLLGALLLAASLLLVACGGSSLDQSAGNTTPAPSAQPAAPIPTGNIVTIEMITDDSGNYFKPKTVSARPGDVLRFVLVTGVHNVHFLPDSNANATNLPPMSTFAQLPGQAIEVPVTMGAGTYYFQCDPHAMLGMVGHVTVEP
ncbi:MAG TPA: plastocyanin/azurin family copper-binding protein [Gemmatimonas sp.]|uniref:plastocyanin/azurin family copper-binding protein n=1 Tax=Gemmatimonas sp. TaxID=1962908 RepID=UPI002EDAA332